MLRHAADAAARTGASSLADEIRTDQTVMNTGTHALGKLGLQNQP